MMTTNTVSPSRAIADCKDSRHTVTFWVYHRPQCLILVMENVATKFIHKVVIGKAGALGLTASFKNWS